jgi:symplekin
LLRAFGAANLDLDANLAATPVAIDFSIQVAVDVLIKTFESVPEAVLARAVEMVKMQLPPSELRTEEPLTTPSRTEEEQMRPQVNGGGGAMNVDLDRGEEAEAIKMDPLKLDLGEEELNLKAEVPPEPIVRPLSLSNTVHGLQRS